jgi:hypothetical protein
MHKYQVPFYSLSFLTTSKLIFPVHGTMYNDVIHISLPVARMHTFAASFWLCANMWPLRICYVRFFRKWLLKDIGSGDVDRINLAQSGNHCFALMNSEFHKSYEISWLNWANIGFSRRSLFRGAYLYMYIACISPFVMFATGCVALPYHNYLD